MNEKFGNRKEYRSGVKDMYDENEDFRITIDLSSPEPIYKQIYNDIVKNIAMGILKKGDRLPSSRELSSILGINYHTVNKAYGIYADTVLVLLFSSPALDFNSFVDLLKLKYTKVRGIISAIGKREAIIADVYTESINASTRNKTDIRRS